MAKLAKTMDQAVKVMADREGKYLTFSMADEEYGWNAAEGHWDQWELTLPYHRGIWPPEDTASWFVCEQAGPDLRVWLCCSDAVEPTVEQCVEVPW